MIKNIYLVTGTAIVAIGLIALPSPSKSTQQPTPPGGPAAPRAPRIAIAQGVPDEEGGLNFLTAFGDEGGSWLGVETQEVTGEKAKELKLPAERGVVIGKVLEESPAAKAGLKDNDVVTEINGQRVEGTAQFRRMIREIPAGRIVQLTVWRDGRAQTITTTLGEMQESRKQLMRGMPQVFKFRTQEFPAMPEIAPIPDIPSLEWSDGDMMLMGRPRLGIDAEDISGQLGSYFGVPDGEGILVREVNPGSAAEKAGVKAGDIITSVNGEKIHGLAELRSKLAASNAESKDKSKEGKTVKLGVLRNKSALSLDVEIPAMKAKTVYKREMRTKI